MTCPNCGSDNVRVKETMPGTGSTVYRRRMCCDCGNRFRTSETLLDDSEKSRNEYFEAVKNKSSLLTALYDGK